MNISKVEEYIGYTMSKRGVTSPEHLYKMPEETQNYVPKVMRYYKNGVL